ncbi:MAG: hypothetical protein R3C69_10565 [Geminicoccaceae bacterium]
MRILITGRRLHRPEAHRAAPRRRQRRRPDHRAHHRRRPLRPDLLADDPRLAKVTLDITDHLTAAKIIAQGYDLVTSPPSSAPMPRRFDLGYKVNLDGTLPPRRPEGARHLPAPRPARSLSMAARPDPRPSSATTST